VIFYSSSDGFMVKRSADGAFKMIWAGQKIQLAESTCIGFPFFPCGLEEI
jgi:hypothetical protein